MTAPDRPAGTAPERIRVVVATPGDAADRLAVPLARGLRDAGMEVVHAGRLVPEALAATVVQEDADAVCLTALPSGADTFLARLAGLLSGRGTDHVVVLACGVATGPLPGLQGLFDAGTPPEEIARWLRAQVSEDVL